jgi:hypothetical protein
MDPAEFVHKLREKELMNKAFLEAKMPEWLNLMAPFFQSCLAICVIVLVVCLLFNFEEILGATPIDPPVELDDEDEESSENENDDDKED